MKYKVKKVGDFENNIEIDIDFEDLESKKDEAISKISKSLKVKGFRPGKIPKNIVIREVGDDYILEESIDLYLPEQIFEILQKEELNPAVRPVVKDLKKEKKSYKVDVLITLWPKLSKLPKLNQTVHRKYKENNKKLKNKPKTKTHTENINANNYKQQT
jgi:trigger factor